MSKNNGRFNQHFNQLFDNNVLDTLQTNPDLTNKIFSAVTTSGGFNLPLLQSDNTPKVRTRKPIKLVSTSKSLVSTYGQIVVKPTSTDAPQDSTPTAQLSVKPVSSLSTKRSAPYRRTKKPIAFGKKKSTTAPSRNGPTITYSQKWSKTTPPKSKATIKTKRWVRTPIDQRRYRDIHQGKINVEGGPVIDPAEEKRVNTLRHKQLVGRTMHGTFYKGSGTHNPTHWIRWNIKSYDNVCISDDLAREVFKGDPQQGVRVTCVCSGLGPVDVVAWKKRPLCETFEIISTVPTMKNRLQAPTSNTRASSWRSSRVPSTASSCPSLCSVNTEVSEVGPPVWVKPVPGNPLLEEALASKPMRSSGHSETTYVVSAKYSPWRRPKHLNCDMGQWRSRAPSDQSCYSKSSSSDEARDVLEL